MLGRDVVAIAVRRFRVSERCVGIRDIPYSRSLNLAVQERPTSFAFPFDVFLSHSTGDKSVVRAVAERLRQDGLKVWFDEWELKPGDSIPARIEEGLESSRVLVLCMSANAFGSDWAQLEAGTFRFRDPLNKARRFIPLRLDDAPIKGSLAQFLYINWLSDDRGGSMRGSSKPAGSQKHRLYQTVSIARIAAT
ncbi:MAG: toll/interleukin-1 receptor domain-containing protein [Bryobacteraceae bacterium]